jgi:hypothetical protein
VNPLFKNNNVSTAKGSNVFQMFIAKQIQIHLIWPNSVKYCNRSQKKSYGSNRKLALKKHRVVDSEDLPLIKRAQAPKFSTVFGSQKIKIF